MAKYTASEEMKIILQEIKELKTLFKPIKANYSEELSPYKKAEKLLYSYPDLKKLSSEADEIINCMRNEGYSEKSKDIIRMPSGSGGDRPSRDEIQEERIQTRMASMKRTDTDIRLIEKVLDILREDGLFPILELWYFERPRKDVNDIIEQMNISIATFWRKKKQLVEKVALYIYGSSTIM